MKKRVFMAVATTTLANLVGTLAGTDQAKANFLVPTEVTEFSASAVSASGTPIFTAPLGDNFADIETSLELRLRSGPTSTGLNTIFLDPGDIPALQDGDIVGLDSIIDVYLVLEFTDQDPFVDFDVDLPTLPGDPNTVVFDFPQPFFFDSGFVNTTIDLSVPNLSTTSNVLSRTIFPDTPLNIGDITGDNVDDFLDIEGLLNTTAVSSSIEADGRLHTNHTASGTLLFSVNPTFTIDLVGTFTLAEDIVIPASAVPVPAALWLFVSGLLGLVGTARRKQQAV